MIFDLDGVLIDSETAWNDARRELVQESGGSWRDDAQRAMMGMSSVEWSRYMHDQLGVPMSAEAISAEVVKRLERLYRERLPLLPGAREAVSSLASRWPLAIASSANRSIIELVLELAGSVGVLPGDGLLRGGGAWQAGARRVPGGGAEDLVRAGELRGGGGLGQRPARGGGGRDGRHRDPQQGLPAGRCGARERRCRARIDRVAGPRGGRCLGGSA